MGRTDRLNMRLGVAIFLAATLVVGLSVIFFLRDRSAVPLLVGANIVFILSISLFLSSDKFPGADAADGAVSRGWDNACNRRGESDERFKTLVENLLNPMVVFEGSRIRFANQPFFSLIGYASREASNDNFDIYSIVYDDDRFKAMKNAAALLDGESTAGPLELRIVTKSGEIRTVLAFSSRITFDGRPAIEATVTDITDIKEMEAELHRTRKRLQHVLDNAPVMIFNLDDEGNFSYANKETIRVSGYTADEWVGKSFAPIVHPDDLPIAIKKFEEGRRGGERRDYSLRIVNAEKEERLLHVRAQTLLEDGDFAGSIIIGQDITEQEELKRRLELDKAFIDQLIENANAMIGVVDERGNFIIFNRRFEEVTGFTKEEALGKSPLSLYVPEESRELVREKAREVRGGSPVPQVEIPIVSKTGNLLTVTWSGAQVKLPSGGNGLVIVGQDVTAQKRMQEELAQSKKIASLGELVSGVAHELNNPLTVVMGYSQILSTERNIAENHGDMAQKVFDAATRSKKIVENLLAFARKQKPEKRQLNMNELIENMLLLREHNFAVNNIKIVRHYDKNIPPTHGDENQLQQVILNLINNAFDAMHGANHGGTLEVKTYTASENIVVEIIDDGPGVPESLRGKIFDPFFTTKEVGKGTGLGMSLSYGIVKEHGGKIYLDSSYRRGAKFVIEIPLAKSPAILPSN